MADQPASSATEEILWTGTSSQVKNFWLFVACILLVPIPWALWAWIKTRTRVYSVTSERLIIRSGFLNKSTESLELYRVRDLRMTEPFWLRLWGLKNLHLCTTDQTTPEIVVDYIPAGLKLGDIIRRQVEICRQKKGVREFGIDLDPGADHIGDGSV